MKQLAVVLVALSLAACSTTPKSDVVAPETVPPAQKFDVNAENDASTRDMRISMTEMLERLDVMNDRIARLEAAGAAPASSAAPAAQPDTRPAQSATSSRPMRSTRSLAPVSSPITERYRLALTLYGQGQYAKARTTFQEVFDLEPGGDLADNALFWIGESWFAEGNFAEASRFYNRVTAEYADQNKAPDALYKTAICFEKTGDLSMAKQTLNQVIARYPYSTAASSAKLELNRIKY